MFNTDLSAYDAEATLAFMERSRADAERIETGLIAAAAHWADLHAVLAGADARVALPGCERLVRIGGQGTPETAEFAAAKLGAVLGPASARR